MCAQVKAAEAAAGKQACYIMCPHATIYVSSYCCMCVLILLHMCAQVKAAEAAAGKQALVSQR
jgi:hypothetical protein